MVRTIIVEERVQGDLGRFSGSQSIQIGLLVGQVTVQKDYVVFFIRTPSVSDVCKDGGGSVPANLFEDWWVVEHSRQVSTMLPGGLSVVGLFLVGPPDLPKTMQPRLRQLLADVCPDSALPPLPHRTRSLLHVCTRTKKHKCQTLDLADSQAVLRPAELKYQPHSSKWHRVECSLALHVDCHVSCNQKSKSSTSDLQKSIQAGLQPTLDSIGSALVLVRGQHTQPEEPLVKSAGQKKSQASSVKGGTVPVCVLLRKAIKQDVARSLLTRVDTLCKSIEAEKLEKSDGDSEVAVSVSASYQLPRRIAVRLSSSNLCLSDYSFPEESEEEFKSNIAELLSVDSNDITLEYLEQFPGVPSQEDCLAEPVGTAEVVGKASNENTSLVPLVGLVLAAAVAVIAVAAWLVQYLIS